MVYEWIVFLINCVYDFNCYVEGVNKLRKYGICVCLYIINGLFLEDWDMMMEIVKVVVDLDVQGIKIYLLYLLKGILMVK